MSVPYGVSCAGGGYPQVELPFPKGFTPFHFAYVIISTGRGQELHPEAASGACVVPTPEHTGLNPRGWG